MDPGKFRSEKFQKFNYCINCGEMIDGSFTILSTKASATVFCNNHDACVEKCLELMDQGYELVKVEIQ